jgi:hypothetical protein
VLDQGRNRQHRQVIEGNSRARFESRGNTRARANCDGTSA